MVKILRRTATFSPLPDGVNDLANQQLQVPKKTKLFVEQTMRERDNAKREYLPGRWQPCLTFVVLQTCIRCSSTICCGCGYVRHAVAQRRCTATVSPSRSAHSRCVSPHR